jgi:hypothetical protein
MNRVERKALVLVVLAGYVGGAVVAAATLRPAAGPLRAVLAPGVAYLAAVRALVRFGQIAAVGPAAMNALYAVAAYTLWWVGAYVLGVRVLSVARGELKATALAFPGVVGVAASVGLVAGGLAGAAGLTGDALSTTGFLAVAVLGGLVWVPALVWLSRVRSRAFGWQSRALQHADTAVEVGAYAVLLAGLALAGVAVGLDVGAQYLVVAVLAVAVVAVTAVVPTGGDRDPGTGFG